MFVLVSADDRVAHGIRLRVLGLHGDHLGKLRRALEDGGLVQKLVEDRASQVGPGSDTDLKVGLLGFWLDIYGRIPI